MVHVHKLMRVHRTLLSSLGVPSTHAMPLLYGFISKRSSYPGCLLGRHVRSQEAAGPQGGAKVYVH